VPLEIGTTVALAEALGGASGATDPARGRALPATSAMPTARRRAPARTASERDMKAILGCRTDAERTSELR
jgi:hypothetical protein